jgi:hypothetical protein
LTKQAGAAAAGWLVVVDSISSTVLSLLQALSSSVTHRVMTAAAPLTPTAQEWFAQGQRIPLEVPISADETLTVHIAVHIFPRVCVLCDGGTNTPPPPMSSIDRSINAHTR